MFRAVSHKAVNAPEHQKRRENIQKMPDRPKFKFHLHTSFRSFPDLSKAVPEILPQWQPKCNMPPKAGNTAAKAIPAE
jgi:hypothetical protein